MKVVYTGLAILLFIGLVFLGVGGGIGGSFLENVNKGQGGGGRSYAAKIAAARKRIAKNPKEAAAWIALTEAQLREATSGESYEPATESYTAKGKQQLRQAASSWKSYLALNPAKPDVRLARNASRIFEALNEPADLVRALQIVIAAEPPSYVLYHELAIASYLANNTRQGDLASKKAILLLPKSRRPLAEAEIEKIKRAIAERKSGGHSASSGTAKGGTTTGGAAAKGSSTLGSTTLTTVTSSSASSSAGKKK